MDEKSKSSLLNPAKLLWGSDNVIDQLSIKPDAKKFWWNVKPLEVLSKLKQIPEFTLHLANSMINGTATVGTQAHKESLLAGLNNWFTSDVKSEVQVDINSTFSQDLIDPNTLLNLQVEYATGASEVPETVKSALNQIATILNMSTSQLRDGTDSAATQARDFPGIYDYNPTASIVKLHDGLPFLPGRVTIKPDGRTTTERDPAGQGTFLKWIYVLAGTVELVIETPAGEERHSVRKRENRVFDSTAAHHFENKGRRKAVFLSIHYPTHY